MMMMRKMMMMVETAWIVLSMKRVGVAGTADSEDVTTLKLKNWKQLKFLFQIEILFLKVSYR